jgi:hypothetical protein
MVTGPYWDERLMIEDHQVPHVLAIGDSWFWFPKNNLLNPIFNALGGGRCIFAIGNNGAEAVEYARDYREPIQGSLDAWKGSIEAVLISGGGNDFAGLDDMFRIIRTKCDGFTSVEQCFNDEEPGKVFDEVADGYRRLIEMIFAAAPQAKVFLHNYDRAIPTGKGFVGNGNWLKEPMTRAHVDLKLQRGIVNRLLFELTRQLKGLAAESDRIYLVDSARLRDVEAPDAIKGRGTLTKTEWGDELHPKPRGFSKLVRSCWAPAFEAAGLEGD